MSKLAAVIAAASLIALAAPAQAETAVCTEIASLPAPINSPGIFCLKKNLSVNLASGSAITINANDVIIDFNGFRINNSAGATTSANGIAATNRKNITLRNGFIRGFLRGVFVRETITNASFAHLVEDLKVSDSLFIGIQVEGDNSTVRNNRVTNTGGSASNAAAGIVLRFADSGVISGNVVSKVAEVTFGRGISVILSNRVHVLGNTIFDVSNATFDRGVEVDASDSVVIADNEMYNPLDANAVGVFGPNATNLSCVDNLFGRFGQAFGAVPVAACAFKDNNNVLFN